MSRLGAVTRVALLGLVLAPVVALAAPSRRGSSTPTTTTEDIRDIRGPIAIANPWRWVWIGGGFVVLAGAVAAGVGIARRRRRRTPTAEARALARLATAETLAAAVRPREYAEAASDAIRAYIEERFGLQATHATTDEFLQELVTRAQSPLGPHRWPLSQFLSACDLAKFARLELPRTSMDALTELARRFVVTTAQPRPTPASTRMS